MAELVEYVYALPAERFAVVARVFGEAFDALELDFEDGSLPVKLERAQLATPGIAVKVPSDSRPLHVQLLRADEEGTRGPLLMWLGKTRLLAFLANAEGPPQAVLAVMTDVKFFSGPDGQLDEKKVRADVRVMAALAARIQKGFEPGESER